MSTTAAERLRNILERESATRLALKRAKAHRFLTLVRSGTKSAEVWQEIATDPDLQARENAYEAAHIDLVVENAVNWGKLAHDDSEGER
jgi:hypothetical protein